VFKGPSTITTGAFVLVEIAARIMIFDGNLTQKSSKFFSLNDQTPEV
jgi:hypothetical protein